MPKKRGKGGDRNYSTWWGDGTDWDLTVFVPQLPEPNVNTGWASDRVDLAANKPLIFDIDLAGRSEVYFPIYIYNDGIPEVGGSNQIGNSPSPHAIKYFTLAFDDDGSGVGFSQESYTLKEAWDAVPADPTQQQTERNTISGISQFTTISDDNLNYYKQVATLINESNHPAEIPKLIAGGTITDAVFFIEDAQTPITQLSVGQDIVVGNATSEYIYAGAGDDQINAGEGDDFVRGEGGNDTLLGGASDDALFGEAGDDVLRGGENRPVFPNEGEYLNGGSGNDRLYGEGGKDVLDGMMGDDILYGDHENAGADPIAVDQRDTLYGGSGNDRLYGGSTSDYLFGDSGIDFLAGGKEQDSLEGGTGADRFDFYSLNDGSDSIKDFNVAEDKIGIYVGTGGLGSGFQKSGLAINAPIAADQFHLGTSAADAGDRFIYNQSNGALFFDPDGTGATAQVQIASVQLPDPNNPSFSVPAALTASSIITFDDTNLAPPSSAIVEFLEPTYQAEEGAGTIADITLIRTGNITSTSQVQVNLTGGTAIANTDYNSSGFPLAVTFSAGETSKTVAVFITQDTALESTESISFNVTSLSGATVGELNAATLEILDDDQPNNLPKDKIIGTGANDTLVGSGSNETILGKGGKDTLKGNGGRDVLSGGQASDRLFGGPGRDIFALEKGKGMDTIQDFKNRQDRLGLTAGMKFKSLKIVQKGRNTQINLGNDALAVLTGIRSNQITAADFVSIQVQ